MCVPAACVCAREGGGGRGIRNIIFISFHSWCGWGGKKRTLLDWFEANAESLVVLLCFIAHTYIRGMAHMAWQEEGERGVKVKHCSQRHAFPIYRPYLLFVFNSHTPLLPCCIHKSKLSASWFPKHSISSKCTLIMMNSLLAMPLYINYAPLRSHYIHVYIQKEQSVVIAMSTIRNHGRKFVKVCF